MINYNKLLLSLCFWIICSLTYGQQNSGVINGIIVDSLSGKGISNVNVFIPYTSIGTTTDNNGEFTLKGIDFGEIKLGLRHLSYSPKTVLLSISNNEAIHFTSSLSVARWELEEVVKIAEMANGKRAYSIFKQYFLGDVTELSCSILNPEVLLFHFEDNKLIASTIEPLYIQNKNLGYNITYYLDYFEFYYERGDIQKFDGLQYYSFRGEGLYSNIETNNNRKTQRWENNRRRLYQGSQRHFFQSLFSGKLEKNGFTVKLAWNDVSEIKKFYDDNEQVYDSKKISIDSLPNYIQDQDEPVFLYYQTSGDPIEIRSTFHLQEDHFVFKMHHPILIFHGAPTEHYQIHNSQVSLMHIDKGFIDIHPTGNYTVTNGTLNWKYLNNSIFIRNYLPIDYYPIDNEMFSK